MNQKKIASSLDGISSAVTFDVHAEMKEKRER